MFSGTAVNFSSHNKKKKTLIWKVPTLVFAVLIIVITILSMGIKDATDSKMFGSNNGVLSSPKTECVLIMI